MTAAGIRPWEARAGLGFGCLAALTFTLMAGSMPFRPAIWPEISAGYLLQAWKRSSMTRFGAPSMSGAIASMKSPKKESLFTAAASS